MSFVKDPNQSQKLAQTTSKTVIQESRETANTNESQSPTSPQKSNTQMKRDRKKKEKALKQFLAKPEDDVIELPRRAEQEVQQKVEEGPINCKICGDLSQRQKQCQFCKQTVCADHIRKKRKLKASNKFARICDECEDKHLYDKYMNLENKAQEALIMQELLIQAKRDELHEMIQGKRTKMQVIRNKKADLQSEKKDYQAKIKTLQNQYNHKTRKFQMRLAQQAAFDQQLKLLQSSLPPPLDDDYGCLVEQNNKITKQLVKYQKLCSEALKANSVREKELYEAYYNWQKKQASRAVAKKKAEECCIY